MWINIPSCWLHCPDLLSPTPAFSMGFFGAIQFLIHPLVWGAICLPVCWILEEVQELHCSGVNFHFHFSDCSLYFNLFFAILVFQSPVSLLFNFKRDCVYGPRFLTTWGGLRGSRSTNFAPKLVTNCFLSLVFLSLGPWRAEPFQRSAEHMCVTSEWASPLSFGFVTFL